MTLKEARKHFREHLAPNVITLYGKNDDVAMRTAFNDWTDALHKAGEITDRQYRTWTLN
jgi:hypothetical protein